MSPLSASQQTVRWKGQKNYKLTENYENDIIMVRHMLFAQFYSLMGETKMKKDSLITKIIMVLFASLLITFVTINVISVKIVEGEVLNQIKTDHAELVEVYAQMLEERACSTAEEYQAFIDEIFQNDDLNYALYIQNVDGKQVAIADSNPDELGKVLEDAGSIAAARDGIPYVGYYTDEVTGGRTLDVLTPVYKDGVIDGALNLGIPVDQKTISAIVSGATIKLTLLAVGFSVVLMVLLSIVIYKLILKPIGQLAVGIDRLANYDLTKSESDPAEKLAVRKDEIGTIGKGFEHMRSSIVSLVLEIKGVTAELTDQSDALSRVSREVADMGNQITVSVNEVANGATSQAQETLQGQQEVNNLSMLLEELQDSMRQLLVATKAVDQNKDEGISSLETVVENTQKNNDSTSEVHEVILETSRQTDKIKDASAQIREIASQTNLLALNASIEAARAGDAGRGFAVVASEIGNLAGNTNTLTAQIEEIVLDLVEKMELTVNTIQVMQGGVKEQSVSVADTKEKFNHIAENIVNIEEKCEHLDAAAKRMNQSKDVIIGLIGDLSSISEENASCMEEAAAAVTEETKSIEQVSASSIKVAELADKLKAQIDHFKL